MAPSRRKGSSKAAAGASSAQQQWKIGDLVLAKMKGFPAWPAMISEPEKWGFSSDRKKLLVYFYGTKQIAFCNHADIEAFTEEKKKSLLVKRQGKGADFVRAVEEIIDVYESLKKQNLSRAISNDGDNEVNASNQEHLEDSRIDCVGNTVEPSLSPSLNHPLEGATVTECDEKVNVDDSPGSLLNRGNHNKNTVFDDSSKKISILDQLRKIPLSSRPTTRKRARDMSLLSSVTKSTSSRRHRSSLVNNPFESQKSYMKIDAELNVGCSASITLLEELTPKEEVVVREHLTSSSAEASPISTRVPLEDILAVKTDDTNLEDGNVLEFGGKLDCSDNETVSNTIPERDARLNSKAEIPLNTVEIKTRRNLYRKQVTSAISSDEMDKEIIVQAEGGSLSDSSNSQNGTTDKFSNADGDEHLPLVKRARVRMGKPSVEESLNESVGSKVKLNNLVTSNGCYESTTSSSPVKHCPLQNGSPKRTAPVTKEFARSSTNGSTYNNTGSDLLKCKLNKYHLMLDVEAALPPSKRLHRALEAMSANAAEVAIDCLQVASKTEVKSSDCLGPLTENSHSGNAGVIPTKPLPMQASGTAAFDNSSCGLSSTLTSQNLVSCCLTSSEVKHEDTNPGKVLNSIQKNSVEIVTGKSSYHGPFTSKITDTLKSSCFELVEKHCADCGPNHSCSSAVLENDKFQLDKENSYYEGARISLKANDTCNSQQLLCSSPSTGAATAMSTTTTVCTASEIDDAAVGSVIVNADLSASDINGIPLVSSATNIPSTTNVCSVTGDLDGAAAASVTTNFSSTVNCTSMATLLRSQDEQTSRVRDMQNVALEAKQIPKDMSVFSKLAPIKDLIAAAQAKRFLSRSTSMCDSVIDGKVAADAVLSPTLINKEDSSGRGSPSNPMLYHRPASDDGTCYLQNGSRTPFNGSSRKWSSKYMNHSEVNAARRCFESLLCTLSRTKDSIGRATRLAIDCAKYGIAGEVIDILLQYLEKESSLYRRVDLFFLVDSITQCSRCQKGGPGDVYPSLVQSVLPRLLTAAAPPGNAASENRRQCLKVLRLWLERKTLPEFTVRHHIRELEYESEAALCISYSRRPPRTERPLNDPVREMEGMLVDEYGSNASFQLPHFFSSRILEDEEGSASDDKGFEAVTPDRNVEADHEMGMTPTSAEKHRHVLEDVDGELEMEDVAPPCGNEASQSTCHIKGAEMISNCTRKCEQNNFFSFAPPLPEERPPSPPPLPSSPPPVPPPCSGQTSQSLAVLTADNTDFGTSYTSQNQLLRPISQKQNSLHCSSSLSDTAAFFSQGYIGLPQQFPQLVSSCTSSGSYSNLSSSQPAMPVGNNSQSVVNLPSGNKLYHLQPPPPVVSNQFSYIHAQPQHRPQAPGNQSSYSDRFHHAHDNQRGFIQVDVSDRSTFCPPVHAASIGLTPEKLEAPPHVPALHGPHLDPSSAPRTSSYTLSASSQSLENPISAPAYWRAR